jgi:hypothetical protein
MMVTMAEAGYLAVATARMTTTTTRRRRGGKSLITPADTKTEHTS